MNDREGMGVVLWIFGAWCVAFGALIGIALTVIL